MSLYFQENLRDLQTQELNQRMKEERLIATAAEAEDRIYRKRMTKELALQHKEYQQEKEFEAKQRERTERLKRIYEQEEDLKRALEMERKQLSHDKVVQYIRNSSQEIRDLEHKLNAARVNKELINQIKERKLKDQMAREKEREPIKQKSKLLIEMEKKEDEQEQHKLQRTIEYKNALELQLREKDEFQQREVEQFLQEKKMIDAMVHKILAEDEKERQRKLSKQKETKDYIDTFVKERESLKQKELQRIAEEDRRIQEFLNAKKAREEHTEALKQAERDHRQEQYQALADTMAKTESTKIEFENLQILLSNEQLEEEHNERERQAMEAKIRNRLAMLDDFNNQMEEKRKRIEHERAEEQKFREQLMKKYAEDERIEQMNSQKRRMKQLEHKRAVDHLIEQKKQQREDEARHQAEWVKHQAEMEEFRRQVVEHERQRLLREHASKLVNFLPKGVIRDEMDLDCFDQQFKNLVLGNIHKDEAN